MWNRRSARSKRSLELFSKNTPDEHQPEPCFCIWETSCGHCRHCNVPLQLTFTCRRDRPTIHPSIHPLTLPGSPRLFRGRPTPPAPAPAPLGTAVTGQLNTCFQASPCSYQAGVFPIYVETCVKALHFMPFGWASCRGGNNSMLRLCCLYLTTVLTPSWGLGKRHLQTGLYLEIGKWLKTVRL